MSDVCVSDIFSRIGYDFLWVDFEHSYLSYENFLTHTAYVGIATGSTDKRVVEHWRNMGADMICAGGDFGFLTEGAVNMFNVLKSKHRGGKANE